MEFPAEALFQGGGVSTSVSARKICSDTVPMQPILVGRSVEHLVSFVTKKAKETQKDRRYENVKEKQRGK